MSPAQCKAKEGLGCPAAFRYIPLMENFQSIIEQVGMLVDAAGVLVIVVGILAASVRALMPSPQPEGLDRYTLYRQRLGRAILLGLELLVAGDIIRTVAVAPTLQNLAVLALIVVIRTFLSFSLEMEVSGRWPWQEKPKGAR
jgi:uncharacterized membrane protein